MKYKNYIWDFDGTLFDSYPHSCQAFWQILGEEGKQEGTTKEEIMRYLQVTFAAAKEFSGISDEGYDRFWATVHLMGEEETFPRTVPFEDCEAVLKAVLEAGGKNYIYTHRNHSVHVYLEKFGMARYFSDAVTEEDGFALKPAPDALLALMERNGLKKEECIMIGDREIDGLAGHNAGIAGALVNYPAALPDGRDPASVTVLEYTAKSLTEFARAMDIPV